MFGKIGVYRSMVGIGSGAVFFFLFSVIMVVTTAATFATYRQYKCVLVQKRIPLSFMIYYNAAIIYSLKTLKNYLEDTIICILQKVVVLISGNVGIYIIRKKEAFLFHAFHAWMQHFHKHHFDISRTTLTH